jgi:hypothetical protein
MLRYISFIAILLVFVSGNSDTNRNNTIYDDSCLDFYDRCIQVSFDSASVGGWLSEKYAEIFNRNVCSDIYTLCKNFK